MPKRQKKTCKRQKNKMPERENEQPIPETFQTEKPKDSRYHYKEVELIPCGDGAWKIPPLGHGMYVNLAQSYFPVTIVPI